MAGSPSMSMKNDVSLWNVSLILSKTYNILSSSHNAINHDEFIMVIYCCVLRLVLRYFILSIFFQ